MFICLDRKALRSPMGKGGRYDSYASTICALLLSLSSLVYVSGAATAAASITDLGKPTNGLSTNVYFPLSGFHRIGTNLHRGTKAELLFIGTQFDPMSAAERWPVVKALNQFGKLSAVSVMSRACSPGPADSSICAVPTFDWSRATYSSKYVYFVHRDVADQNKHLYQSLSGTASTLYNRYARGFGKTPIDQINDSTSIPAHSTRRLPLVAIGSYLQTISESLQIGDFEEQIPLPTQPGASFDSSIGSGLPFDTIQKALLTGHDPKQTALNADVNGETNVIIALICHADKLQPARVCGRSVIKRILRHVK